MVLQKSFIFLTFHVPNWPSKMLTHISKQNSEASDLIFLKHVTDVGGWAV